MKRQPTLPDEGKKTLLHFHFPTLIPIQLALAVGSWIQFMLYQTVFHLIPTNSIPKPRSTGLTPDDPYIGAFI